MAEEPPPACLGSSLRARRNNWMPRSAMLASNQDPQVLALVGEHPPIVTAIVKAYVHGDCFDPTVTTTPDDLAPVIVPSTARD